MLKRYASNGAVLSLLSSMLFAMQFPLIKLSFGHISPQVAAVLECAFTALLCLALGRLQSQPMRVVFDRALIVAGLLNALGLILLFEGLARVHPGVVGLIGRLYFVYAMLIAYLHFQERPNRGEVVLISVAIFGVFLISFQTEGTAVSSPAGVLLAFCYPAFFAIQNAVIKPVVKRHHSSAVLFNTKIYAFLPLAMYFLVRHDPTEQQISAKGVEIIFLSTFLSTFLGLLLFYKALGIATFRVANLMKATEPVFVLLFSFALFPVALNLQNTLGTILILAPVAFVALTQRPQEVREEG